MVTEGLSCARLWVCWSRLEPAVSGLGQPWQLLLEAAPQPPLPAPGHLHSVQHVVKSYKNDGTGKDIVMKLTGRFGTTKKKKSS